ncbi:MAG: IctB family putative bicarbonate transporter [Cyanophyceae cyanobacterium]
MDFPESPMLAAWRDGLLLSQAALGQWRRDSFLGRWIGALGSWESGSFLLSHGDAVGSLMAALIFAGSPFIGSGPIGIGQAAAAGFWLLLTIADGQDHQFNPSALKSLFTPIHLPLIVFGAIAIAATGLSPVPRAALSGLFKLGLYLIFFALMARVLRSPKWRSVVITVYLYAALIVATYGIHQFFHGVPALATWVDAESSLAKTTRVYSSLGNPNLLAGYLVPAVPLAIAALFNWRGWGAKALAGVMVLLNSACLVLTYSRGGWIGLLVALGAIAILLVAWWSVRFSPFWKRWALPILLGSGVVLIAGAILFVGPIRTRVVSIFAGRGDSSNNFRINVWTAVLDMIRDRPWLGIGPGNGAFNKIYPLYQRPKFTALSAYSVFLEICVETGLIGAIAFLWLLTVTLSQAWHHARRLQQRWNADGYWILGATAAILGMMAHGAVDTVWYRPQVQTAWWLMVAIIASYWQFPKNSQKTFETP